MSALILQMYLAVTIVPKLIWDLRRLFSTEFGSEIRRLITVHLWTRVIYGPSYIVYLQFLCDYGLRWIFFKKFHVANHKQAIIKIPSHLATDNSVSIACILQKEVRGGYNGVKITPCPSPPVFYDKQKVVVLYSHPQYTKKKLHHFGQQETYL